MEITKMQNDEKYRKIEETLSNIFNSKNNDIYLKQILDEISIYLNWVKELKLKYRIKKEHSIEYIAQQILSKITKSNFKYHIEAFYISLKEVASDLNKIDDAYKIKISNCNNYIKGVLALLNDLILDFNEIYWQIEEIMLNNPQSRKSGRRRMFMGREIFKSPKDIVRRLVNYDEISYSSISVFLLRQSIEITILRALGIYSFVDINNCEQKIKLDKIIDFIEKNKKYIKIPVEMPILKKIIKWSNPYVHKAVMNLHWQIIIAQKVLLPLFVGGKDKNSWSIHGAIKINKKFYHNDLEQDLIIYLKLKNTKIIKFNKPDCLLTDNNFEC